MDYIITALISYLFGSIPFGYIFTKIFLKKDIRDVGSGNIGATNVLRTGNKRLGYLTLILDIIKAVIPVIYIKLYYPDLIFISALCAFLGHLFPVWLKFDGGKGVATYVGILISIDFYYALIILLVVGAIQVIIGNIIEPKWMGNSMNISPLVSILSLMFWGLIWGTTGMIVSVPFTVVIIIILSEIESTRSIAILLSEKGDINEKN